MNSIPNWLKIALVVMMCCGLDWRLQTYAHRSLETDEINQYKVEQGKFIHFWQRAYYAEVYSFPGDYLLTRPFVKNLSRNIPPLQIPLKNKLAIGIPQFFFTLLSYFVLFLLCRRHLSHPISWLIVFLMFSMNRELIFHSMEMRPYSVLIGLGLATFYLMENLLAPSIMIPDSHAPFYFLYFMLVIGFHPYGAFILFFCAFYFLLKHYRSMGFVSKLIHLKGLWAATLLLGISLWIYYQTSPYATPFGRRDTFEFIANPAGNPFAFFKTILGSLIGNKWLYPLAAGFIIRMCIPRRGRLDILAFLLLMFALPILVILVSDIKFDYWFLQRQFIWLSALFPLLIAECWDGIFLIRYIFPWPPKRLTEDR